MKKIKPYLLCTVLSAVSAVTLMMLFGFFSASDPSVKLRIFADSLSYPAISLLSLSVLCLISKTGFFDIIGYGASRLSSLLPSHSTAETYSCYRARAAARRKSTDLAPPLTVGAVMLTAALLCILVLYTK